MGLYAICEFFPQIASGPISKAADLLPQIKAKRNFRYEQFASGWRCLRGAFSSAFRVESLETVREWRVFKVTQKSQKAAISV